MMIRVKKLADKVVVSMLGTIERWDASETSWIVEEAGNLPVEVYLDSPGGDPLSALSIGQTLASLPNGFTCFVEGLCCSAAPLIALRAKRIIAAETALFMIHGAFADPYRPLNERDLENAKDAVRVVNETTAMLVSARTGKTIEEVKELLKNDTWYTAAEALKNKFVDEVKALERTLPVQEIQLAAHFKNVPATILQALPENSKNQKPNTSMSKTLLDRMKATFGLQADADDVDAAQKLIELKAKADVADAVQAQLKAQTAEIETLKAQVAAAAPKPDAVDAELSALVEAAVEKFQVKASDKDALLARFKGNVAGFKDLLAFVPEGAHKPGLAPRAPGSDKKVSARYPINAAVNQAFGELK